MPPAPEGPSPPRGAEGYVYAVASLASIAYGTAIGVIVTTVPLGVLVSPGFVAGVVVLLGSTILFQLYGFEFRWRGHRLTANLEETVLFVSFLYLPGALAVMAVAVGQVLTHARRGRPSIKGLFNVAHDVLAAAVAWGAFSLLRHLAVPPLVAAVPAVLAYVVASNLLLAGVFARLEGVRVWRVFLERLMPTTVLLFVVGVSGGLAVYALASVHPLAVVALTPFAYTIKRNTVLASRADREIDVHRRLATVSHELVGTSDLDAVADRVLAVSGPVLNASRAVIRLEADGPGDRARSWRREFEASVSSAALVVDLPGARGTPIGELSVHPRSGQAFGDLEHVLASLVAGNAASAFLNARALMALERAREDALAQQDRLAKQEKLSTLGMLIANVAHEVGNPVAYMRTSLELSLDETARLVESPDPVAREAGARMREDIESALRGAHRLAELTESLKSVARQGPKGFKRTDLNDLARDVTNVVRVGMPRSVTLDLDLHPSPVVVSANRGEVTQVVLNLVKNAAEAIGQSAGTVRLRTRIDAGRVRLAVEDNGPGIPEDVKRRLFTPFFTTKEKGTGLGLNISRRIVEQHGGSLLLESEMGRGTTFTLDLPLAPPEEATETAASAAND